MTHLWILLLIPLMFLGIAAVIIALDELDKWSHK